MRKAFEVPLSVVVLVLFSGVAFLNFYRINRESLEGPSRTLRWYFTVLAIAVVISLAAKTIFRSFSIARIFLIAAAISFMALSYDEIKLLVSRGWIKALVGDDGFTMVSIGSWAVATVVAGVLIGIISKRAIVTSTMALVGGIYIVPATMSVFGWVRIPSW